MQAQLISIQLSIPWELRLAVGTAFPHASCVRVSWHDRLTYAGTGTWADLYLCNAAGLRSQWRCRPTRRRFPMGLRNIQAHQRIIRTLQRVKYCQA